MVRFNVIWYDMMARRWRAMNGNPNGKSFVSLGLGSAIGETRHCGVAAAAGGAALGEILDDCSAALNLNT